MNSVNCERWQGWLAMRALGVATPDEVTGLLAHLDGCEECRTLADELSGTVQLLDYVDPAAVESMAEVPAELTARVLDQLRGAAVVHRRRRRRRSASMAFVGALAAAVILLVVIASSRTPDQRTLALHGSSSVTASAVLVDQSWGTSVHLSEHGLPANGIYTVSMKTANGTWWTAGTYRAVAGKTVNATMACAVSLSRITSVRVVNATGVTVLASDPTSTSTY